MRTAWSLRKQRREVSNEERNTQMDRSDHRFHRHSPADGIRYDLLRRSMLNKVKALPGIMLGRAFSIQPSFHHLMLFRFKVQGLRVTTFFRETSKQIT